MEKIEPNTIYLIHKDNFANQVSVLVKICMTLKYAKREPINPDIFIEYVTKALAVGSCIILVTFNEKKELNCCVVTFINNNPVKGKILFIEWAWSDAKSLALSKKVFDKIEELARIINANKVACSMTRGYKAVGKRYGLKEEYRVMAKDVKKEFKKEVIENVKDTKEN